MFFHHFLECVFSFNQVKHPSHIKPIYDGMKRISFKLKNFSTLKMALNCILKWISNALWKVAKNSMIVYVFINIWF